MTTSAGRSRARRRAGYAGLLTIVLVGVFIDWCGVVNVPGAFIPPAAAEEEGTASGLAVGLFLIVAAAWPMALWRSRPVIALIAGAVLAAIGPSYLLLLVGAVLFVRRNPDRLRRTALWVVGIVVGYVLRDLLTPWGGALVWFFGSASTAQQSMGSVIATVVLALLSLGVTFGIVYVWRTRARIARSDVRAEQEQQRADALTEEMARQSERERIARDMHDALAHRLSVVSLHAGALEASAGGDGAQEIARTVREQTHAALQDMRGLIGELRSGPASSAPTTMRSLGALVAELRAAGVPLNAHIVIESPERASARFDSAVHRIVQESLTNALKHAPGAPIDVFVQVDPGAGALIRVENPLRAVGSDVPGGRHGIHGIRERTSALDGTVWIGPHDGRFIVDARLPWQENA